MDLRRLVLGLGNPGPRYERTRHNLGSEVVDRVAERFGLEWVRRDEWFECFGSREGEPFALFKPLTYMNRSGLVLERLREQGVDLAPEALLVVIDDLALEPGRVRIRAKGSSGGHNGLKSVESVLGAPTYPRLRLGIGSPEDGETIDYVLGVPDDPEEQELLRVAVERGAEATILWLSGLPCPQVSNRLAAATETDRGEAPDE